MPEDTIEERLKRIESRLDEHKAVFAVQQRIIDEIVLRLANQSGAPKADIAALFEVISQYLDRGDEAQWPDIPRAEQRRYLDEVFQQISGRLPTQGEADRAP